MELILFFSTITSIGGGKGAPIGDTGSGNGATGGSGGGGGAWGAGTTSGGAGTANQGFAGGGNSGQKRNTVPIRWRRWSKCCWCKRSKLYHFR